MISLIEALNFRCLHYIQQPLDRFHVLVGPNASGKTTFLDTVAFLGKFVSEGLKVAIEERGGNFQDLTWRRTGNYFEIAIEAVIPEKSRELLTDEKKFDTIRYELRIEIDSESKENKIKTERVLLKTNESPRSEQLDIKFPVIKEPPETIVGKKQRNTRTIINKGENDNFYSEVHPKSGKGWAPSFKLGPQKSALGNLPEDESKFPVSTWFKTLLKEGVQKLMLNSLALRNASPPGQPRGFKPDGSNLPWVINNLAEKHPDKFKSWLEHLQTALPELENVRTVERPDDKHKYLIICYKGGLEVPSWMASDGTLRLLALTLPAYLPELTGIYLIEEPENGIHPRAVEPMFQSLSSVYDAQILLATHSPVILSMVDVDKVLCFARTEEGSTDIVIGSKHPNLKNWHGETNLSVLFAGGVLG